MFYLHPLRVKRIFFFGEMTRLLGLGFLHPGHLEEEIKFENGTKCGVILFQMEKEYYLTPSPSSSSSASGAICCFSACSSLMASATASTIGNIIAVVAVFEIHIERNIVVNMKPNISLAWCTRSSRSDDQHDDFFFFIFFFNNI